MNKLSNQQIKLDERNHVELPLLDQLKGLGWEVLDLQAQQTPGETHRSNLTEVLMLPVLTDMRSAPPVARPKLSAPIQYRPVLRSPAKLMLGVPTAPTAKEC